MSKKLTLATLFHRGPAAHTRPAQEQANEAAALERKLKASEIDTRFRESLASGKTTGDILLTDENGNVVRSTKNTNIFEL